MVTPVGSAWLPPNGELEAWQALITGNCTFLVYIPNLNCQLDELLESQTLLIHTGKFRYQSLNLDSLLLVGTSK